MISALDDIIANESNEHQVISSPSLRKFNVFLLEGPIPGDSFFWPKLHNLDGHGPWTAYVFKILLLKQVVDGRGHTSWWMISEWVDISF